MMSDSLNLDRFVTDFGDGAVLLPILGVCIILFAGFGWFRGAIVWGALTCTALGVLAVAKLGGLEWAYLFGSEGRPLSVSGHVTATSAIYGSLLNLLIFRTRKNFLFYLPIPALLAYAFSYTRLALHSHTPAEVILGSILGMSVALISSRVLIPMPRPLIIPTLAIMLIVIGAFYGYHSNTEGMIQSNFSTWPSSL